MKKNENYVLLLLLLLLLTAIGLTPGDSGYFTCTQIEKNEKLCIIIIIIIIVIIIIIIINCNWVDTRWQWLFYMHTNMKKMRNNFIIIIIIIIIGTVSRELFKGNRIPFILLTNY